MDIIQSPYLSGGLRILLERLGGCGVRCTELLLVRVDLEIVGWLELGVFMPEVAGVDTLDWLVGTVGLAGWGWSRIFLVLLWGMMYRRDTVLSSELDSESSELVELITACGRNSLFPISGCF